MERLLNLRRSAVAANWAARAVALLAAAASTWLVARLGGPTAVGVYALFRILPGVVGTFLSGGLPGAAAYFLAGPSRSDRRVPLALPTIALGGGLAGTVLWIAASPLLQAVFFRDIALVLVGLAGVRVLTYLVFTAGRSCLQGTDDLNGGNLVFVCEELFFVPILLACWAAGLTGTASIVVGLLVSDVGTGVVAWGRLAARGFFRGVIRPSFALVSSIYCFGMRGQVGNVLLLLNLRLDFAILGVLAGAGALGSYAVASRYAELLRLLPLSVFWVFYPSCARADGATAAARARALMPKLAALTLVVAVLLGTVAVVLLPLVFGPAFEPAVLPSQILLGGLVGEGVAGIVTAFLYGRGRPGLNSMAVAAGLVVTLGLDLLLIPGMGAVGAALASSSAYMTTSAVLLVSFWYVTRAKEMPNASASMVAPA